MINLELIKKYKNLKKLENSKDIWTIENLKDGFDLFYDINGKYPTSGETDTFPFLPTRKTIERRFGGMVKLRETLCLDVPFNLTKGHTRSVVAKEAFKRAQDYEKDFFNELIKKIPEVRVHEHKIMRPGDTASDFFIYTNKNEGIFIDLFYAKDMHSLSGVVRIKSLKCLELKMPIYFILVGNTNISQEMLNQLNSNRKIKLLDNINIITHEHFLNEVLPKIELIPMSC